MPHSQGMLIPLWVLFALMFGGFAVGLLVGVLLHPLIAKVPPYDPSVGDDRLSGDRRRHDASGSAGY